MICYRDSSYCSSSDKCVADCGRRLSTWDKRNAEDRGLPVAYADYRSTDQCPGFEPKEGDVEANLQND